MILASLPALLIGLMAIPATLACVGGSRRKGSEMPTMPPVWDEEPVTLRRPMPPELGIYAQIAHLPLESVLQIAASAGE